MLVALVGDGLGLHLEAIHAVLFVKFEEVLRCRVKQEVEVGVPTVHR